MTEIAHVKDYEPTADLLEGRVVMITGAGDGIGAALAKAVAGCGGTAILVGRTTAKLETVYDAIVEAGGPRPAIFVIDFETAGAAQYDQLGDAIAETYGLLDGLVHNAGILGELTPIEHFDVLTWQRVLHVNLTAPFILTRSMFPFLRRSEDASVIFTSSGVGRKGRGFWGAYAVSKFGTEGLMETLADELGESTPIRANAINPGATKTSMRATAFPAEDPDQLRTAEEIMGTYLYLLGPASRDVNGRSFDAQPTPS